MLIIEYLIIKKLIGGNTFTSFEKNLAYFGKANKVKSIKRQLLM